MNFGTIKTRLALNAGNMQSSHPMYSSLAQYSNDGLRFMLMRASQRFPNFQLFPEHKDVEWLDVTLAGQNWLALPSDHIAIQRAFSADTSTSPDFSATQWRVVAYVEPFEFDQLPKPSTQLAYPTNFTVRENKVKFWPTPQTNFTTYVKLDGIEDEPDMVNASDTPRTNVRWHPAWLDCATYLLMNDLRRFDDAQAFLKSADDKIQSIGASLMGLRRAKFKRAVRVSGAPKGVF